MKRYFLLSLIFFVLFSGFAFAQQPPILRVDTGGHVALIRDIVVHPSGRYFITGSDDKTIRVWRVERKGQGFRVREERKILGQIGDGPEGKTYAIALSPDARFLAVGGYMERGWGKEHKYIRLYDFSTGKLLRVLKGHEDTVFDLSFSEDGRYLISGGYDKRVIIWDMKRFKKAAEYKHDNFVYAVSSFYRQGAFYVVSGAYDHKIKLFSFEQNRVIREYDAGEMVKNNSISVSKRYGVIAVAVKNKRKILFFDLQLNLLKKIKTDTKPVGTALSPSERYLAVGTGSPYICTVYDLKTLKKVSEFKKHDNLTLALAFLDDNTVLSGGENDEEIWLWKAKSGDGILKAGGRGKRVWAVGISGSKIGWGNVFNYVSHNNSGKIQKYFDLRDFRVKNAGNLSFERISTRWGQYSLSHAAGGDYGYSDAVLVIKKHGDVAARVVRDSTDGYGHNAYGFTENGLIVSGGSNGQLWAYNTSGQKVARFIGHLGEVWSIATQGRWLVSGGSDQRIILWDLKRLDEYRGKTLSIYPTLCVFVSSDDEWVAWTKSGYFTSSANGGDLIGWHVNQGYKKEALWYSADKFYRLLYKPEFVRAVYKYGNEELAKRYVSVREQKVAEVLPPIIELAEPVQREFATSARSVEIRFCVRKQSDLPIEDVKLLVNGANILSRSVRVKARDEENCFSRSIPLVPGRNLITITARNKYARSNPVTLYITRKAEKRKILLPDMYLLTVGTSRYKNPAYNLRFADRDALAIKDIFKKLEGRLFKKVYAKVLINEKCTRDNVLDGLDWLDREATQHDLVVVFVAGHGINDDRGNYYFLTHEAELDRLRRTAVKWREFEDLISGLNSKVLFFVDTCHSGNIYTARRGVASSILDAIQSLKDAGAGTVIFSATTGRGFSYEDEKLGHGAFTQAVIEGLDRLRADFDQDGQITIKELDLYITRRVKELSHKRQKPTTIIPAAVPDFPIYVK